MALVYRDRTRETSTSTGTGNFTLAGAQAGFQRFWDHMSAGDTCYYTIVGPSGTWETGLGTMNAANVLIRTQVLESSDGDAAVNFAAGTKDVFMSFPALGKWALTSLEAAVGPYLLGYGSGTGSPVFRTMAQAKSDLGLDQVSNTADANKPVSTATQAALNTKSNIEGGVTGVGRTITGHGWDQIFFRMIDSTTRKVVSDISSNYMSMYYNGSGWPVIRVDATDFPVATRQYVESLVAGRLAGVRAIDVGWIRPTANSGDSYPGSAGDYVSGLSMGANGFTGAFYRRLQMHINGAWQNIYAG